MESSTVSNRYHEEWFIPMYKNVPMDTDRYTEIGKGSFGMVYGVTSRSGLQVAIKQLKRKNNMSMEEVIRRSKEEAKSYKMFENNPNIVKFHDFVVTHDQSNCYMVLEWCKGGTLANEINLDYKEDELFDFTSQIITGLKDLHRSGFCHFDLKPENIGIVKEAHSKIYKLLDFGLLKETEKGNDYFSIGTPPYIAPEFSLDEVDKTEKVDIFSLGCILYEMAYKNMVYNIFVDENEGTNNFNLFSQRIREGKRKIILNNRSYLNLNDLILKCLEPDPQKRYSIQQIENHLRKKCPSVLRANYPSNITGFKSESNRFLSAYLEKLESLLERESLECLQLRVVSCFSKIQNTLGINSFQFAVNVKENNRIIREEGSGWEYYGGVEEGNPEIMSGFGVHFNQKSEELYIGNFKNSKKEGVGVCIYFKSQNDCNFIMIRPNLNLNYSYGSYSEGQFMPGASLVFMGTNSVYSGETKNRKAHGKGKLVSIDQDYRYEYEGFWEEGYFTCLKGEFTTIDCNAKKVSRYEGKFKEDTFVKGTATIFGDEATADMKYIGNWNGLSNGEGKICSATGDYYYKGSWENLKKTGEKAEEIKEGQDEYHGGFLNDLRHGKGRVVSQSESITIEYEGNFASGHFEGFGKLKRKMEGGIEEQYEGNFVRGKYEDENGELRRKDYLHRGRFLSGMANGKGKRTYYSHLQIQVIEGYFDENSNTIQATEAEYLNGDIYKGPLVDLKRSGEQGILEFSGCEMYKKYVGGFVDDKMEGRGKIYFSNNKQYEGEFREGRIEGRGVMEDTMSLVELSGRFENGKIVEGKAIEKKTGIMFEGTFFDGQMYDGPNCRLIFKNGDKYSGQFYRGKRTGEGKLEFVDGRVYEGTFKENEFSGIGNLETKDFIYEGGFLDGKIHGKGEITIKESYVQEFKFKKMTSSFLKNELELDCFEVKIPDNSAYKGKLLDFQRTGGPLDREAGDFVPPVFDLKYFMIEGYYLCQDYKIETKFCGGIAQGRFIQENRTSNLIKKIKGNKTNGSNHGEIEKEFLMGRL